MNEAKHRGRVTIPTDVDVVPETLEILERWGADAIRDCDGTDYPEALKSADAKVYSTYYTTRKDNVWAKANPDEVQQCYIMTGFHTAVADSLSIPLMQGVSDELMKVNTCDDIKRWWEVVDRTASRVVPAQDWSYDEKSGNVIVHAIERFHEYTVSFLAYLIWDPVHMYNAVTNGWKNFEHQITFDVRQPKTHKFTMQRLRKFIAEHPYVNVIRYTTFFHQFTLVFDELQREKYVDSLPFYHTRKGCISGGVSPACSIFDKALKSSCACLGHAGSAKLFCWYGSSAHKRTFQYISLVNTRHPSARHARTAGIFRARMARPEDGFDLVKARLCPNPESVRPSARWSRPRKPSGCSLPAHASNVAVRPTGHTDVGNAAFLEAKPVGTKVGYGSIAERDVRLYPAHASASEMAADPRADKE